MVKTVQTKTRVFLIDPCKWDVAQAAEFGELTTLYNGHTYRPSIWQTDQFCEHVLAELVKQDFDNERDCILVAGPMVTTAFVIVALASEYGSLNLVVFDPTKTGKYVMRKVGKPFPEVEEE